jgi:hypothetical protein
MGQKPNGFLNDVLKIFAVKTLDQDWITAWDGDFGIGITVVTRAPGLSDIEQKTR